MISQPTVLPDAEESMWNKRQEANITQNPGQKQIESKQSGRTKSPIQNLLCAMQENLLGATQE